MSSGKILLGVVTGVAVGALIGVLFAPEKGSVTRKKISKKSDDNVGELKEKFKELLAQAKNEVEMLKEKANAISENGTAKAEKLKAN